VVAFLKTDRDSEVISVYWLFSLRLRLLLSHVIAPMKQIEIVNGNEVQHFLVMIVITPYPAQDQLQTSPASVDENRMIIELVALKMEDESRAM
jgi:hypothetical protein